jgi:hypothetical protein
MIETEMKKKTRTANDYMIERPKIFKGIEDLGERLR